MFNSIDIIQDSIIKTYKLVLLKFIFVILYIFDNIYNPFKNKIHVQFKEHTEHSINCKRK